MKPRDLDAEEAATFKVKAMLVFLLFQNPPFFFKESKFHNVVFLTQYLRSKEIIKETELKAKQYKYPINTMSQLN